MTTSCPDLERWEVIHPFNVESNCGFSVAKEAMYCIVFFSEYQLMFFQMLFFF